MFRMACEAAKAPATPNIAPTIISYSASAYHHTQYLASRRPERHADTDLMRAAADGVVHHAIDAGNGYQQSRHSK
jgi:hypothetical protein